MLQSMRSAAKWIWWFVVLTFVIVFVFAETSGLTSMRVTRGTAVGVVNGENITYDAYLRASQNRIRQEQQQRGQSLTLDDERQIDDATFNEMVSDILLQQEYQRRGISVSSDEIRQAAQQSPPPEFFQAPEFQTDGQFDLQKYQRFLNSPMAKQQGVLAQLEQYYRERIPQAKLFDQIQSGVYVTDPQLWRAWQDAHDSAQVTYVVLRPDAIPDSAVKVSDAEIQRYFNAHQKDFGDQPGRAVLTVTMIPRTITAADTAAARAKAEALRSEILGGAKFEDVAKRESADTVSAKDGGFLGRGPRGRFVKPFEDAAYALKPGEISQPVLTPFGFHLIKVDARNGDTIAVRHILLRIQQSDSSANISDRKADQLAKASGADHPALFDSLVKQLNLPRARVVATEGEPLTWNGQYVPSVSAWAFGGVQPGEVSDLMDADNAYYMARLDSLRSGGKATLAMVRDQIRQELVRQKKVDLLVPRAQHVVDAVKRGQSLDQAAQAAGLTTEKTAMFARTSSVPGLGQANQAVGAAFGLAVGAVSDPIKTSDGVYVVRTDRRVEADKAAWEKQKKEQRESVLARLRQQRVQEFLAALRENAKVKDNRKEIEAAARQSAS